MLRVSDSPHWGKQHKEDLFRCIAADGIWPREHLRLAGYATDGLCKCGEMDTLIHRFYKCPFIRTFKEHWGFSEHGETTLFPNSDSPLWVLGLMRNPALGYPKSASGLKIVWNLVGPSGPLFDAPSYGDGSGKHGKITSLRRCGWGVVSACPGPDGVIHRTAEAYGPLPLPLQHVPVADFFALLMYLTHAFPDQDGMYIFYTDCAYMYDSWHKGFNSMTNGWSTHADIWKLFSPKPKMLAWIVFPCAS